jgi:hypothetical protein
LPKESKKKNPLLEALVQRIAMPSGSERWDQGSPGSKVLSPIDLLWNVRFNTTASTYEDPDNRTGLSSMSELLFGRRI